jgi:hypothetical protein
MAETETKKYLVNVESNLEKYAQQAVEAGKKVDQLTIENLKLRNSTTASRQEIETHNAALKVSQKEYTQAKRLVELQTKANNSEANSRDHLTAIISIETARLNKLGDGYTINAKGQRVISEGYKNQVKNLADARQALISYDQAQNSGYTNVGRYSSAFADLGKNILSSVSPMALVAAGVAAAKKIFDGFKDAILSTSGAMDKLNIANQMAKQLFYDIGVNGKLSTESLEKAAEAAALMNEKRKGDRKDMVDFALLEREIAMAEFDSADKTKTHAERQEALNKAIAKQNELSDLKIADAKEDLRITEELIALRPKDEKLQEQYAKNITTIINLDRERFEQNKRNQSKFTAFQQEELDRQKEIHDGLMKAADEEIEMQKEKDKKLHEAKLAQAKKDQEIAQQKIKDTQAALQKEIDDYKAALEAKKQADEKWESDMQRARELHAERQLTDQENLLQAREENNEWMYNTERDRLNIEQKEEIKKAKETGADVGAINAKYAAINKQLARDEQDAKLGLYADFATNLATIFGENTAIGKAAAVASATISTYQAANAAYASLAGVPVVGPVLGAAAAAAAIVAGIANVKKILAVNAEGENSAPSSVTAAAARVTASQVTTAGTSILMPSGQLSQQAQTAAMESLSAQDISDAMSKVTIVTTIEDINAKQKSTNKVVNRANI